MADLSASGIAEPGIARQSALHDVPDILLDDTPDIVLDASPMVAHDDARRLDPLIGSSLTGAETLALKRPRRRRSTLRLGTIACLLATGALLGLSTNLAKLAGEAKLAPLAFLAWSITGASALLIALAALRGHLPPLNARTIEYFLFSAFVTIAASNLIVVAAVPQVGAVFVAPAIALPPLLTYVGALCFGLERFDAGRAAGVVLALAGAAWIALRKLSAPDATAFWVVMTLAPPVLLAIGNLYRTMRWPSGLSADALAPGMLGAAAMMLLAAGLLPAPSMTLALPTDYLWPTLLIGVQTVVFAGQFLLLLELQRRGGPVYLSLLGSVAAVISVPIAVLVLGEQPPEGLAVGALLIGTGILLLTLGGLRGDGAAMVGRPA